MSEFSAADHRYMARALALARKGLTTAHPNPRVGCVLVRGGEIVGEGWHRAAGEPHAEVNALAAAGARAQGATAYVTLEPCAHTGRTGPCTRALIEAGVAEVVYAHEDPSPHGPESGHAVLEAAGLRVRAGLLRPEARRLNEGFFSRRERGRPFVRLKIAASLDGATAMLDGESRWITDEAARADVQRWRAASGAIVTGAGTVLADDPLLTVRDGDRVREQPLRVVVDSRLETPPEARLFEVRGPVTVFCADDRGRERLEARGAAVYRLADGQGRVDLPAMLAKLAELAINDVLVEAGPSLCGALLAAGLADELVIYQAPHIMGSETRRMFTTPRLSRLADRVALELEDVRRVGTCLRITARPVSQLPGRE
ncbi:MAG TPA: bifunctional diaminohydroxyphosphoribosylaminopyrimidine deaminase/5-amino-6-(5-phosphoribosylamino)uracil reductase RibD [Woeseiaceae bacterium]|nr:bifunctional diaminohydroxyphosphoribosylaminopyrimidine deaminase/5-amino-6-(5-phosphoribosylamino)uracil reductase RibD [Woeseiaceae bacterium]